MSNSTGFNKTLLLQLINGQKSLRRWREEVHLSQEELASLAGVAQQTVSRLEQGKRNLTPEVFDRLIAAINKKEAANNKDAEKHASFSKISKILEEQ